MTLAAEQATGRVEPDPATSGQEDLGPGVEVGDVPPHPLGLVGEHPLVGELHQVARGEACRQPAGPEQRDQEQGLVAAAAPALGEGLLRRPDARLLADDVAEGLVDPPVHLHRELHGGTALRQRGEERVEATPRGQLRVGPVEEGGEIACQLGRIGERDGLAPLVDEEVERVDRPDVERQLDQDLQRREPDPLAERDVCDVVAGGILLPADRRPVRELERIVLDDGARVGRWPQPDGVGAERRRRRIAVGAPVLEEDAQGVVL